MDKFFIFKSAHYIPSQKIWFTENNGPVKVGYTRHGNLRITHYYSKEDSEWYPTNPTYVFNRKGECTSHPLSYRAINKGAKERHHRLEAI